MKTRLSLARTGVRRLTVDFFAKEDRYALERLDLGHNRLSTLPRSVEALTRLETLSLRSNQLTTLPLEVGALQSLRVLDLTSNPTLTEVPVGLSALGELKCLRFGHAQLTTLPDWFAQLASLEELDLSDNAFARFPRVLMRLPLKRLAFGRQARRPSYVSRVCSLGTLEVLTLDDLGLRKLPARLGALSALVSLDVSRNPLTTLPDALFSLRGLERLEATGCAFDKPTQKRLARLRRCDVAL